MRVSNSGGDDNYNNNKNYMKKGTFFRKSVYIPSRGGSRTAATSKAELFVIIVNGLKPLPTITKSTPVDVAAVLDPPLPCLS